MQTLAEIRIEILRLKWHVAAWREEEERDGGAGDDVKGFCHC
jgi:hypothetical protein